MLTQTRKGKKNRGLLLLVLHTGASYDVTGTRRLYGARDHRDRFMSLIAP